MITVDLSVLAWMVFIAIIFGFILYWHRSANEFKDVIVGSWKEADFYYGKQGTEFEQAVKFEIINENKDRNGGICRCERCNRKTNPLPKGLRQRVKYFFGLWRVTHVDHIIPYVIGGQGIKINGRILCHKHNIKRGARIKMQINRGRITDRDILLKVWELKKKIYTGNKVPAFQYKREKVNERDKRNRRMDIRV